MAQYDRRSDLATVTSDKQHFPLLHKIRIYLDSRSKFKQQISKLPNRHMFKRNTETQELLQFESFN